MPRKPLIRDSEHPYHVYARANNREWFYLSTAEVWALSKEEIRTVSDRYSAEVISFVLMNNHFHMLLWTPKSNIDAIMNFFMRELSRKIGRRTGRINHVFGGPYRWSLIRNDFHLSLAYKYVYRNPVVGRLCATVEGYPFSTLKYLLRPQPEPIPLHDISVFRVREIPAQPFNRLSWLNTPFSNEQHKVLRNALRRKVFAFTTRRNDIPAVRSLLREYQK